MNRLAIIVADSGFSAETLRSVDGRVAGFYDLTTGLALTGQPTLSSDELSAVANDPLNHGNIVMAKLARLVPGVPLILIRALGADNRIIRTARGADGSVQRAGWVEGYRWAVALARSRGWLTVANSSFGGYPPADALLWEGFQLAQEVGSGKPGHIFVAATGPTEGHDHVSAPAVFPNVIAVGLRTVDYSGDQWKPGSKPDVLLPDTGSEISFRTPEVTAAVARLLIETEGNLDVDAVRALLGKYPDVTTLVNGVRS
jgi:hypothetical protein